MTTMPQPSMKDVEGEPPQECQLQPSQTMTTVPEPGMEDAEGGSPQEHQLEPSQQITVPEVATEEDRAAITPESLGQAASFREDDGSDDSSASAPAALQSPTPAPPQEGKDPGAVGAASSSAPAPPGSAAEGSSRTICLRTLRVSKSSSAISSLAGWGGVAIAAAAAAAAATATGTAAAAGGKDLGSDQAGTAASGGLGVLPTANKVVDLRQVKKVKPGSFEATAAAAAAVAAAMAAAASAAPALNHSETLEEEGGPVKIDISAGKRMIEFQLKQNAAEEKREAARLKSEKDRADAAAAEESQRMLAQVNARMQAKRSARGGLLGWGKDGLVDQGIYSDGGGGSGGAMHVIAPNQVRNLAEKHGIVVRFVDEGAASGVAQVRALARAHGIRIQILGEDGEDGGGDVGDEHGEERGEQEEGQEVETPVGGRGVLRVVGNDSPTPPPVLSSLRRATPARRSPSPVPQKSSKAPPKKTPTASAGGGMFSGPARMMRRALEASGGCVPSANEASPVVAGRGGTPASSTDIKGASALSSGGAVERDSAARSKAASVDSPSTEASLPEEAQQERVSRAASSNGPRVLSTGGTVRPRPASAESSGSVDATTKGTKDGAEFVTPSRDSRLEVARRRTAGGVIVAAAAAAAAAAGSTGSVLGRKRREVSEDSRQGEGGVERGATAGRAPSARMNGGGGGGGGAAGGRMEGRLGSRNTISPSGEEGGWGSPGLGSPETMSSGLPSSAPKRMRLVAPSGVVVSQTSSTPSSQKSGRRAASGARGPGNNNLFKGAMAGIIGRGKRPAP